MGQLLLTVIDKNSIFLIITLNNRSIADVKQHHLVHNCFFPQEKRMTGSESSVLARQKDLLLQKLDTFERTNRTLRRLLREQHEREVPSYFQKEEQKWSGTVVPVDADKSFFFFLSQMDSLQLLEQKDSLLKRLTEAEAENSVWNN